MTLKITKYPGFTPPPGSGSGGGAHPGLATHDALGLATDAELAAFEWDIPMETLLLEIQADVLELKEMLAMLCDADPALRGWRDERDPIPQRPPHMARET